jgi:hypothetical protein
VEAPELAALPEAKVLRNGELWPRAAWGKPVPVDAGRVTIEVSAPGRATWRKELEIGTEPAEHVVNVPELLHEPEAVAVDQPAAQASAMTAAKQPPAAAPQGHADPQSSPAGGAGNPGPVQSAPAPAADQRYTKIALTLGALGLGAVGAGTYFAIRANSLDAKSDQYCEQNECLPAGYQYRTEALMSADAATLLFVVGGGLLAGAGLTYWIGRPAPAKASTARLQLTVVNRGSTSLLLSGKF